MRRKGLKLNTEKTKIMRCKKGRRNRIRWKWEGRYRGSEGIYVFGIYIAGSREKVKRKTAVMGKVWSIRKRKFGKEWGKRMWMFDKLVWTVI